MTKTASAAELSSTPRRRGSKHEDSRSNRRGSGSQKRRDSATSTPVISHGTTMTTAGANRRRRSSGGIDAGAGLALASTSKPAFTYSATASAAVVSASATSAGGGGRRESTTSSGDHSRKRIRDAVRAKAPKEDGGYVDAYLCSRQLVTSSVHETMLKNFFMQGACMGRNKHVRKSVKMHVRTVGRTTSSRFEFRVAAHCYALPVLVDYGVIGYAFESWRRRLPRTYPLVLLCFDDERHSRRVGRHP